MSDVSPGGTGSLGGTNVTPGTGSTPVANLLWTVQLVADATVAPADTPTTDTSRLLRDAAGKRYIWTYSTAAASWKGVEES